MSSDDKTTSFKRFLQAVGMICGGLFVLGSVNWYFLGRFELCTLRMLWGVPCPGCGLTHSLLALVTARWQDSLAYHPLTVPLLLTFLGFIVRYVNIPFLPPFAHALLCFFGSNRYWLILAHLSHLVFFF